MKFTLYTFMLRLKCNRVYYLLVLFAAFGLSNIAIAQDHYYYYNGEKQFLELNTEFVYVAGDSPASTEQLSSGLKTNVQVSDFRADNAASVTKSIGIGPKTVQYWAEIKLPSKLSEEEYEKYSEQLKSSGTMKIVSPYFKTADEKKVGLSHYFHVKLKKEEDFGLLRRWANESDTEIVGQDKFMPLWYMLQCTEKSKFNALDYANMFYESDFFMYAEPEFILENISLAAPNDPMYADQWGLNNTGLYGGTVGVDVNALDAWEITKGSRDVVVAVLDQGIEMNHPDLAGNILGTGFNTVTGAAPSVVSGAHGTACAGIVGAIQDNNQGVSGVAPNSRLMSVSNPLSGSINTMKSQLAAGLNWAWQNGADVISNSWGHNLLVSNLIDNAITNALNNGRGGLGTIVVFAAGNNNNNVIYPASSNPDIISVGAMSPCAERKSPTSCDTENLWGSCFGADLDVMAPGVLVSTTDRQNASYNPGPSLHNGAGGTLISSDYMNDDYTIWFNGTSSACPMVAGIAALVLSVNPCLTHDEVEDIIEETAQKVGSYTYAATVNRPNGDWNNEMGYGLVDAEAAVLMAQSMLPDDIAFDIYSKDRPFDTGAEPGVSGPMWISEDIWVRQDLDGGLVHENPEYKQFSPNAIYVKVTNRGTTTSDCANLSVYFSKASTGLVWPTHWDDYTLSGVLHGDKINTVSIPAIAPGASEIIEVPWYPPNPADFTNDIHHFCLLARIESPADPMFNEQIGIGVSPNVRNNNNIVWKNVSVYDNVANFVSVFIRPNFRGWSRMNINFLDRGFEERIEKSFFDRGGEIFAKVDPELFERLLKAELDGIKIIDENLLYIASPRAGIYGLEMHSKETFSMHFAFNVELDEKEQVLLDVVQTNAETKEFTGGERFIITHSEKGANTPRSKTVIKSTMVFPNPTSDEIFISYETDSNNANLEVSAYNVLDPGASIRLFTGAKTKGKHTSKLDVTSLKKGIYMLKIKIGDDVSTERIVIK